MASPKRSALMEELARTPPAHKRRKIMSAVDWSKSPFTEYLYQMDDGESTLREISISPPLVFTLIAPPAIIAERPLDKSFYYFNQGDEESHYYDDGRSARGEGESSTMFLTHDGEAYYTPDDISRKSGEYVKGFHWRTFERKFFWDSVSGLLLRTPRKNLPVNETLPEVDFRRYRNRKGSRIYIKVNEDGTHAGNDPEIIEDLSRLPSRKPPLLRKPVQVPRKVRRRLFHERGPRQAPPEEPLSGFADVPMKIEETALTTAQIQCRAWGTPTKKVKREREEM